MEMNESRYVASRGEYRFYLGILMGLLYTYFFIIMLLRSLLLPLRLLLTAGSVSYFFLIHLICIGLFFVCENKHNTSSFSVYTHIFFSQNIELLREEKRRITWEIHKDRVYVCEREREVLEIFESYRVLHIYFTWLIMASIKL